MKHWIEKFIEYSIIERGLSPRTIETYQTTFKVFFYFLQANDSDLSVLNKEVIRSFLYYGKKERNWGNKTYHIYYDNLSVFCDFLVLENALEKNPVKLLKKPKTSRRIIKPLETSQVETILQNALYSSKDRKIGWRNYTMFYIGLNSGLRLSEIINLFESDIDFQNKTILVRQGKGDKDREIAVNNDFLDILLHYVKNKTKFSSPRLFVTKNGNRFTVREFHRLVEIVKKNSGIHFSAHDLRRTYATTLSKKGIPPFIIQQQLGHTNIKTTMRYVVHSLDDCKKAISKISLY